jgi:hypothetical protein
MSIKVTYPATMKSKHARKRPGNPKASVSKRNIDKEIAREAKRVDREFANLSNTKRNQLYKEADKLLKGGEDLSKKVISKWIEGTTSKEIERAIIKHCKHSHRQLQELIKKS